MTPRLRQHGLRSAAAAAGDTGGGSGDSSGEGAALLWGDGDDLAVYVDEPEDDEAAAAEPGAGSSSDGSEQPQRRAPPPRPPRPPPPRGVATLAAVLEAVPERAGGAFDLDEAELGASTGDTPSSRPGAAADEEGWVLDPHATALLLQARAVGSFEAAADFARQHRQRLGAAHAGLLWCRLRRLLLELPPAASGGESTAWVAGLEGAAGEGVVMLGGGAVSSSGDGGGASAAAPRRRGALPPAAGAAIRQAMALTARCGRDLTPLGAAAALTAMAAARRRGFDAHHLDLQLLRRLRAQVRAAVAAGAARATPRQLAECLLALPEVGWELQAEQLAAVADAACAAAPALGAGDAGLLLAGMARVGAAARPGDRTAAGDALLEAAGALFDAYHAGVVAVSTNGPADAAAAASVLQALSALPGARRRLLAHSPARQAALEALLEAIERQMGALGGAQLAVTAVAAARLGAEPWPSWLDALHASLALPGRLQALPGPLLAALLAALAAFAPAQPPPRALVFDAARALSGRLAECAPTALAGVPLSLLALRAAPPPYFLEAFWQSAARADWRGVDAMRVAGMAAAAGWLATRAGFGARPARAPGAWRAGVRAALGAADAAALPDAHRAAALAALRALGDDEEDDGGGDGDGSVADADPLSSGAVVPDTGDLLPPIFIPGLDDTADEDASSEGAGEQPPSPLVASSSAGGGTL